MISNEHRCIFIHIPKTAGTSIEKKLGLFEEVDRDVQDHRTFRELEPFSITHLASIFQPADPYFLKRIRNNLRRDPAPTRRDYGEFFKFSFVRNPWARAFSWYRNVMRDDYHLKTLGLNKDCSLNRFLLESPNQWALRPQMHWLKDSKGGISLDFVGKFETLSEDFQFVAKKIGLDDWELPHLIVGDSKSYTQAFDAEARDLVATKYAEEIELFKYRFGE